MPELRFGNILDDAEIMEFARREAFELIREDPNLADPRNYLLRKVLRRKFKGKLDLIHVG